MPKLIIMNAGTEQMLGQNLDYQQKLQVARAAWRNLWYVARMETEGAGCCPPNHPIRGTGKHNGLSAFAQRRAINA